MDYLVSIEDHPKMWWQVNLLHQSMKRLGTQDRLAIAVARTQHSGKFPTERVMLHANVGQARDYTPLNKPYAVMTAVKTGFIKQPFTLIDPDTFFVRDMPLLDAPMSAQIVSYMSLEATEQFGYDLDLDFSIRREDWLPIGCVYQFRDVPAKLFTEIYQCLQEIIVRYPTLPDPQATWQREMVAFVPPVVRRKIAVRQVADFEMPLDSRMRAFGGDPCLVHYCNGLRPYWDKRYQNPEFGFSLQTADPYQSILGIPSDESNVFLFKQIVREFLAENTLLGHGTNI